MRSRHPPLGPEVCSLPFGKSRRLLQVAAHQSGPLETGQARLSLWPSTCTSAPVPPFSAPLPGTRSNVERCFVGVSHTIDFGFGDGSSHPNESNDDSHPIVLLQPHRYRSPKFLLWGHVSWLVCSASIPRALDLKVSCVDLRNSPKRSLQCSVCVVSATEKCITRV